MPSYKYIVLMNPRLGCDADFNRWYDERHVPDVMKIPGVVSIKRFESAGASTGAENPKHTYLTIIDIEAADLRETIAALTERMGTDAMPISDTLDLSSAYAGFYRAL